VSVINWTDTVTPLNAVNMNALEQTVRKGQANGYASLDAGTKVPIAQLPAGTANGVASLDATGKVPLAQDPISPVINGQWLKGSGGVPVWSAIAAADLPAQAVPTYGSAPPGSPADGAEHILTPYQWRFRYNAGSASAYKWEFIGGPPGSTVTATSTGGINSQSFVPLGVNFNIPRSGDYYWTIHIRVANDTSSGVGYATVITSGGVAQDALSCFFQSWTANGAGWTGHGPQLITGCTTTLAVYVHVSAGVGTFGPVALGVWPSRIS
jgi:hypothetical protein